MNETELFEFSAWNKNLCMALIGEEEKGYLLSVDYCTNEMDFPETIYSKFFDEKIEAVTKLEKIIEVLS